MARGCLTKRGTAGATGLTLLEMLMAVTLVTVLVAGIYTALKMGRDSSSQGERRMQRYASGRATLDYMAREIQCAMISSVNSNIYWLDGNSSSWTYKSTSYPQDDVNLISTAITGDTTLYDLYEVGYQLDTTNKRVQRRDDTTVDGTFDGSYQDLSDYAIGLSLRYYKTGSGWQETWDSRTGQAEDGQLPAAVEISLTTVDELEQEDPQTFTTVAYLGDKR